MNIIMATILEGNINDNLYLKLVFIMTYINWPTKALQNLNSYKSYNYKPLDLAYL